MNTPIPTVAPTRLAAVLLLRTALRKLLPDLQGPSQDVARSVLTATTFLQAPVAEASAPTRPWGWAFRPCNANAPADWTLVTDEAQACQMMAQQTEDKKPVYECEPLFSLRQILPNQE